jgi:polyphenol oxidase
LIRSASLASSAGLGHAHSDRRDGAVGNLRLPNAPANRAALVRAAGGDPDALCVPAQVHGAAVAIAHCGGLALPATDALATATPRVPLLVQGADCPLLALFDADARVVAVAHSGWRGTVARIGAATLDVMRSLGASPERTSVAVFPGIGPCCFEVGLDVVAAFASTFGAASRAWFAPGVREDKRLLDVRAAIVATLVDAGVRPERIDVVPGCTACGGALFSHRASRGGPERHGLCALLL